MCGPVLKSCRARACVCGCRWQHAFKAADRDALVARWKAAAAAKKVGSDKDRTEACVAALELACFDLAAGAFGKGFDTVNAVLDLLGEKVDAAPRAAGGELAALLCQLWTLKGVQHLLMRRDRAAVQVRPHLDHVYAPIYALCTTLSKALSAPPCSCRRWTRPSRWTPRRSTRISPSRCATSRWWIWTRPRPSTTPSPSWPSKRTRKPRPVPAAAAAPGRAGRAAGG